VVFDSRTAPDQVGPLARMCARAGIDAVWLAGALEGTPLGGGTDPWAEAHVLASTSSAAAVGVFVEGSDGLTAAGIPDRLEISLITGSANGASVRGIRQALAAAGVRARLSALIRAPGDLAPLLAFADDVVLSAWHTPDLETAADEARAEAVEAGRDPASLGVAALLPVSVGRTVAEAAARADMDADFARFGHPADIGIFGTLEECQDRVIALAHAGITDLRCVLPATPDIHDVIAQLTAITLGTTDVLVPGSLRSPSPPPPEGWGGRPDRPPTPRVSSGSRRRG
jgi:hypothetical protein